MIRREGECLKIFCDMTIPHARKLLETGASLAGTGDMTVDLAETKAVDSSALAVLLEWTRQARARGKILHILRAPEALKALAALYSLDALMGLA